MMNWNEINRAVYFSFRHSRVRFGAYLFLITLLCSIIITLTVWLPVHNDYSTAWTQNVQLKSDIHKENLRDKLVTAYKINKKHISQIEKKLSIKNSQAEIINGISQLAQRSGISIVSESYNEGKSVNGYDLLNQNLILEGEYSSIRQFLRELEHLSVWTIPQEVRLKVLNDNQKRIRANLKLTIYTKLGFN